MTFHKPDEDALSDEIVEIAERQFLDALRAMSEISDKIRRQELDAVPDMPKAAANAALAVRHLLTEKNRVYEQQKRQSGIVHDFAIDFDAARAEIGRRLARLRAAGEN